MDKNYIKSLKKDLLENGLVSEALPEYLNSKGLSNISFKELTKSNRDSSPMTINLSKKDGGNRTIYLPNPVSYQQCVNTVFKDKNILEKIINKIENNRFSHSKILWEDGLFNIPIKGNNSKYIDSKRDKMFLSVGKKYSLKYDIEKFYDNIYTHYLPAGLIGFDNAIEMYRNHIPQSSEYKYMCNIDKDIRNMCNAETKGIVTGPFISRIFSELLQSEIDKEIFEKTGCENFRRFVDDTEMYLKTLDEAEKNIVILKNIFQRYKLSLKMEKTEIKQIPYIDFSSLKEILNIRINKIKGKAGWYFASQEDFFETIYKAEELERNNNTGALKYILKILNNKNYEYGINTKFDQKSKSFLYLLNYIIVYPRYAKEILKIVDIHIKYIEESKDILNNFLTECIDNRQELVCLYIIQILIKLVSSCSFIAHKNSSKSRGNILSCLSSDGIKIFSTFSLIEISDPVSI